MVGAHTHTHKHTSDVSPTLWVVSSNLHANIHVVGSCLCCIQTSDHKDLPWTLCESMWDAQIRLGELTEVGHIDLASTTVSLALFVPFPSQSVPQSFQISPLSLSLSPFLSLSPIVSSLFLSISISYFSSVSLQHANLITPLSCTQAINQGLPSSCTYISLGENKTNKGLA